MAICLSTSHRTKTLARQRLATARRSIRPMGRIICLPNTMKTILHNEGLFASLNDCLYRSMYRYSHVALIDLDEFIIPHHNDTLIDLITWLSKRINNRNTGAYSFQNAFFYLQFADDEMMYTGSQTQTNLRAALTTQRKTRRRSKLHPQKQRSKYICKPEAVIEAGNHFVWEFCPGRGSLNVPADAAILHHYRVCEFGGDDCIKTPSLVDRTAHRYSKRLLDRVGTVYNYLKETCSLPDIPRAPTKPPPTRKKELKIRIPLKPEGDKKVTESNQKPQPEPVSDASQGPVATVPVEVIPKTR